MRKAITFNSVLDAVNYMSRRGWDFEQMYVVQSISGGDSSSPAYHLILSKEVTEDAQIMEEGCTARCTPLCVKC